MTSSKLFDSPTVPTLRKLVEDVVEGGILIPEFQRDFVWKEEQQLDLLDSVLRGMPIGSLLIWRTRRKDVQPQPQIGPCRVKSESVPDHVITTRSFLLDGLQRITTLVGALAPREDDESTDPSDGPRWTIYYDLAPSTETPTRERLHPRPRRKGAKIPPSWLPLYKVLDDFAMSEFQSALKVVEPERKRMIRESQRIAALVKDYPIPVVPIVSDDLNLVTESFQRVNYLGTRMSEEHMATALTFASGISLPKEIKRTTDALDDLGWRELEGDVVLAVLKASFGLELAKPRPVDLQKKLVECQERGTNPFDELAGRLRLAVSFLAGCCDIRGPAVLPYTNQLVALCEAIKLHGDLRAEPLRWRYARWFWATTFGERFASLNSTQVALAIKFACTLGDSRSEAEVTQALRVEVGAEPVRAITKFNFNSARTRALCVMLARAVGRTSSGSDALELLGAEGNDTVHVFARKLSQSAVGNRLIVDAKELPVLRSSLRGGRGDEIARLAKQYMVPATAITAWRSGDEARFIELRGDHLWDAEKAFIREMVPGVFDFEDEKVPLV